MRKLLRVTAVAAGATALTFGLMQPASAIDGSVYSKALTPGSSTAGGSISASIVFNPSDRTKVMFNNLTVNDTCPGDSNWAGGRVVIKYMDGTMWYGPIRLDTGGCESAKPAPVDAPFDGSKQIDNAGVQGLVMNGTSSSSILARGAIDWRDNQYT